MSTGTSWELREGDALAPELTAVRLLGGGDSFEAYLAFDEITYSPVVVKILRPALVEEESSLRALSREVDMLRTINHPGVVRILRSEVDGERPHVVLEHVEGPRLSTLIRKHGALQPQQYLPLIIDLAAALHYFRRLGVVHLDVKPSNIIMGAPARLIDLSVARSAEAAGQLRVQVGTDAFMSPEQVNPEGDHAPGFASDVWGLGATLFEAVSGQRAFPTGASASAPAVRYPQLTASSAALSSRVPRPVADIIRSTLELEPRDRPRPDEIAAAVEPMLAELPRPKLTFKVRV